MTNICSTCLSQERALKRLDTLKKDETLEWLHADFLSPEQAMVCWECESDLNHADTFRRRAVKAQGILRTWELGDKQIKSLPTLRTSDVVTKVAYPKTDDILKQIRKNNVKINPEQKNVCHIAEIDIINVDEYKDSSNIVDKIKNMIEFLNNDVKDTKKDYVKLFSIIEEIDPNIIETDNEVEAEYVEPATDEDEPLAKIQKLTNTLIEPLKKNNDIIVHNVLEPVVDLDEPDYDSNDYEVDMNDPDFNIMEPIIDITEPGLNQNDPIATDDNSDNIHKTGWPVLTLESQNDSVNTVSKPNCSKVNTSPKIMPIPIKNLLNTKSKSLKISPALIKLQNKLNSLNAGKSPITYPSPPAKVAKLHLMQAQKNMISNYNLNKQNLLQQKQDVLKRISLIQKLADSNDPPKLLAIKPDVLKQAQTAIPVFKIPKNTEMLKQAELLYQKRAGLKMHEEIRIYNATDIANPAKTVNVDDNDFVHKPLKCEACLQRFATQPEFDEHREQFHSERAGIYICSICTLRFQNEELLKCHYMEHTDMDCAYKCKICSFKHREKHVMEKHVRDTHELKKCQFCTKQYKSQEQLSDHVMKTHMTMKELRKAKSAGLSCQICKIWFLRPEQVKQHMLRDHASDPELDLKVKNIGMCCLCNKSFPMLDYHMMSQHPEWKGDSYCKECKMQFVSKSRLSAHLKQSSAHNQPRKFMCEHCARSFPLPSKLAEHVATVHENKLLYACDKCDQSFSRKHKLKAHKKSEHKKKKTRDHICHECGAAFYESQVLKSHMNIHAAVKPYHCAHCEWQFSNRGAFITHLRGKHPEYVVPRTPLK